MRLRNLLPIVGLLALAGCKDEKKAEAPSAPTPPAATTTAPATPAPATPVPAPATKPNP